MNPPRALLPPQPGIPDKAAAAPPPAAWARGARCRPAGAAAGSIVL